MFEIPDLLISGCSGGSRPGSFRLIREVIDLATGMKRPIENGRTGEQAQKKWEAEHGNLDEPAYLRKRRRRETGEI